MTQQTIKAGDTVSSTLKASTAVVKTIVVSVTTTPVNAKTTTTITIAAGAITNDQDQIILSEVRTDGKSTWIVC